MKGSFESKSVWMKHKALIAVIVLVIALMGTLVGCSQGASSTSASSSAASVTVSLKVDATDYDKGVLFDEKMTVDEGKTLYDALMESGLELDVSSMSGTVYIDGIDGIVSSKISPNSGWLYEINGEVPSVGVDSYVLEDGDEIVFTFYKDAMSQM